MKLALSISTSLVSALALACSSNTSSSDATGGTAPQGNGGASAQKGGAPGSGGAITGSGGAAMSGGASSGGSQPSSGGLSASGGASAGGSSGGMSSAAGGDVSGGASIEDSTMSGGRANGGSGNAQGGGSTQGGAAGSSGSAGASSQGGAATDTTLAGMFDGALITYPCGSGHSGFDCDNVGCTNGKVTHNQTYKMGGTTGTVYDVTFRVRGVVEVYNYVGGTRDAGNDSITKNPDLFLRGGAPQAAGANGSDYDVYELNVSPAVSGEPATYFLNSVINSENPHTSNTTLHLTFKLDYTKTIKVGAGATITVRQYDSNCVSLLNCGTNWSACNSHHTVSLDGASPAAPSTFTQPFQMPTGVYPQWLFFDVTNVKVAQ